ncbi:MAG: hypothetical protein KDD58_12675 [Bdellovibrionales bacterium]|nr:hypothetical protein [Bdellovibrionales bacterium]
MLTICSFLLVNCAYQFGYRVRRLPGGYRSVSIPVFENKTQEVGLESYFTNALIREFERSQVAKITNKSQAPVFIEGKVNSVLLTKNTQAEAKANSEELKYLPKNTTLNTSYRVSVEIHLKLIRNSDKKMIWQQHFVNERVYSSAQISVPGINSVNPLYNHSAKHQNISTLAQEMMKEAHDRITERF